MALLCLAVGTVGSVLRAHDVAHSDADEARANFNQTATSIASTLTLTTQREEDLALAAGAFFAANPQASSAQFATWAKFTQPLSSYPELERLALVKLVRGHSHPGSPTSGAPAASSPAAGSSAARSSAARSSAARSSAARSSAARSSAASAHAAGAYRCVGVAGLARGLAKYPPAGLNYCAEVPGLLASRSSGRHSFVAVPTGHTEALGIETPVYRGGVTPHTAAGRRAAFVGWLHELLVPGVVLQRALQGHPGSTARLRYRVGSTIVTSTSGTPAAGAQSATAALRNGWTATIFGPALNTSVLDDGQAVALLFAGILLSALLALLAFALGTAHQPPPEAPAVAETVETPSEDLYDPLTGLPNRALTLDLATRVVARTGRQSGMVAGALVIDIDWFRDVNEKLGHGAGDQLLKIFVERLEGVVRTGDTVGRLGGDEFVVLVESQARGIRLDSLARRVIEALHKPVELDGFGPSFYLTASIGIAFGRYTLTDDLLRDARLALQASKVAGKDRYTMFNATMRSVTEGRGMLELDLNTALEEEQFFLLYQPIRDLKTQEIVGLEALIRWLHPKQGVLGAEDFMPLAEETGLIVPIGRWMLEQACSRAAAWHLAGHRIGISVSVAATQLYRDGFATDVRRALQQSGAAPSLLTLEIAEETVMLDLTAAATRIAEIKQLGVRIAIDDFGNNYAYRSALQQMPLDFLRVDRSSLASADDEDYRSWLLEAILHFGRDISLTVIAKGVGSQEQLMALQEMGCTMGQGPFTGEPAAADAIERLLKSDFAAASALTTDQFS